MNEPETFGAWLRRRRELLDLTRAMLASCAGCSVSALRKIETDERRPSRELAATLADCLAIGEGERDAFVTAARSPQRMEGAGAQNARKVDGGSRRSEERRGSLPLPVPTTPFVGREAELATLSELLQEPNCRLVSLIGPGGIGKTRLALTLAESAGSRFAEGVCFVPLAAAQTTAAMVTDIAQAAALHFAGSNEPRMQLLHGLAEREMLLVLDNMEQLLADTSLIEELLATAPRLKLLVTSRERLGLRQEWVFEVSGLPVPESGKVDALTQYGAVALFTQRAKQAWLGFALTDEVAEDVARICQLVEGAPLAIELAAAWVHVLSPVEIVCELESGIDILATQLRDVPERHQSMRTVFEYTWRLLEPPEQQKMQRLALFPAGFTREAAAGVADATLVTLLAFADKGLLRGAESGRYEMHGLLRQFCLEKLRMNREDREEAETQLARTYAGFMQAWQRELSAADDLRALREMEMEWENIQAAWHLALSRGSPVLAEQYVLPLETACNVQGRYHEGAALFEAALDHLGDAPGGLPARLRVMLRTALARMYIYSGRAKDARDLLELALSETAPEMPEVRSHVHRGLGAAALVCGNPQAAEAHFQQELLLAEQGNGSPAALATAHQNIGWALRAQGDLIRAKQYQHNALALLGTDGPRRQMCWILVDLGNIHYGLAEPDQAWDSFREAVRVANEYGYQNAVSAACTGLGLIAYDEAAYFEAANYLRQSLDLERKWGDTNMVAARLALLVAASIRARDKNGAQRYMQELTRVRTIADGGVVQAWHAYAAGEQALVDGCFDEAAESFGRALAVPGLNWNMMAIGRWEGLVQSGLRQAQAGVATLG